MPKKRVNYSNTVFYKLVSNTPSVTHQFVGHTTNLVQRKHALKQMCTNRSHPKYNEDVGRVVRANGGWSNWHLEVIETRSCVDHAEAKEVEEWYRTGAYTHAGAVVAADAGAAVNADVDEHSNVVTNGHVCTCGRSYKHQQSFNRHQRECGSFKEKEDLRGMINTLIHQNQEMLMENKEMRTMVKDMIPKIGNTTINKFNLQVFLNERCKDAINMSEFVSSLELELSDLDDTRRNGYVQGITNIFVRGLRKLEQHQRPIHCSDLKREVLYVKDNDAWEKEGNEKTLMKRAIGAVSKKQIQMIKEWEDANPGWKESERGRQMYIEMIRSVTSSVDNVSDNKIIRTIAREVTIDK